MYNKAFNYQVTSTYSLFFSAAMYSIAISSFYIDNFRRSKNFDKYIMKCLSTTCGVDRITFLYSSSGGGSSSIFCVPNFCVSPVHQHFLLMRDQRFCNIKFVTQELGSDWVLRWVEDIWYSAFLQILKA